MQRHFSNRGEALPELTAARMMASRSRPQKPTSAAESNRRARTRQWFSPPAATTPQPKKKQPNQIEKVATVALSPFPGRPAMRSPAKKHSKSTRSKLGRSVRRSGKINAAATIRKIGANWARHWNARELDGVVAAYAEDAVYLPPHHAAVHGRDAIREYLKAPLRQGVSDLEFEVNYIKQQGPIAWDVGTYRMNVSQGEGTKREDRGKYLTVWRRLGKNWLISADAWSSDLPPAP
jgi:uncharacterized protein (TIGR02246 family)